MNNTSETKWSRNLPSKFASLLVAVTTLSSANSALADTPTIQTYNSVGSGTWTAPAGVSLVQVEVWGGGGAGGGALKPTGFKNGGGGGGGGGAYARFNAFNATPGNNYSFNVGTNGIGVLTNKGTAGSDSWFVSSTTLDALGGSGGGAGIGTSSGAFGIGNGEGIGGVGGAAGATGDAYFSGGAGTNAPSNSYGGGGGGSAGVSSAGNSAGSNTGTGGAAVTGGGAGGNGGINSGGVPPSAGSPPGGGGGGYLSNSTNGAAGANGAPGQVQFTYYPTPTMQASGASLLGESSSSIAISWTPGNVGSSLVLVSAGSPVSGVPVNGTIYTPNATFGSGSQIGNAYVVYQSTGNTVTVTGLSVGITYYVAVYAVNGAGTILAEYLTSTPATGSGATASVPTVSSPTKSAITTTTATLGATVSSAGGGAISSYGIVWATTPNPTTANNKIQAGTSVSPPNTFTVNATGLPPGTTIYYAGYATSGSGTGYSPQDTFTTLASPPTQQAAGVSISSVEGGAANVAWTPGNGANRIVVVSAGAPESSNPVAGTTYTADPDFGSGSQLGTGNYVVYLGNGTNVTVTALTPGTTYYVAVYELNGSGGSEDYLTSSPATGNSATPLHPVVYYSSATASDPSQTGSWWTGTNGTGANPGDFLEGDTFVIQTNNDYTLPTGTTWAVNANNYGTAANVQINPGGTFTFDNSGGASPYLQLGGNFAQFGTVAENGTSTVGYFEFTSSGAWTGSGVLTSVRGSIIVDNGATLDASGLSSGFFFRSTNHHGLKVQAGGTLSVGTLQISGGSATGLAYFQLNAGGTLITAGTNSDGIPGIFTGFPLANVTLSSGANYIFDGIAAQNTGTTNAYAAFPATVNNLVISNTAGVKLSQSTAVNGTLTIAAGGILDLNSNTLTDAATSLSGSGTLILETTETGPPDAFSGSELIDNSGSLNLAGNLQVSVGGNSPVLGDQLTLFQAGAYTGSFASLNLPPLANSLAWSNSLAINGSIEVISGSSPSANAFLASLVVSNNLNAVVSLTPVFTTNGYVYFATNTLPANAVNVTVTDADPTATNTLLVNGISQGLLPSGTTSAPLSLNAGSNNVTVQVVSQSLATTNNYAVSILEQPSQTAPKLTHSASNGTLNLSWDANHLGYRLLLQTNNLSKGISTNPADWSTVAGSTTITSTNIAIPKTSPTNGFYQLVYP